MCPPIKTELCVTSKGGELISRGRDSTQPECIGFEAGAGLRVRDRSCSGISLLRLRQTWNQVGKNANLAVSSAPALPHSIATTISKRKASEVEAEQLCLQMRIFVTGAEQCGRCSSISRLQCAPAHRTAAASSSSRRQKGAEQQQRKAQQQPGCFALLW